MIILPQIATIELIASNRDAINLATGKVATDFSEPDCTMMTSSFVDDDQRIWYGIAAISSLPSYFPDTPRGGLYLYLYCDLGAIDLVRKLTDLLSTTDIYTSVPRDDQLTISALQSIGFNVEKVRKVGCWKKSLLMSKIALV